VLAHRGGGSLAPENTLAALRESVARGFRGAEFDVMLAADEVPVLIHDQTLERTTTGRGAVNAHSAAQLAALDAGRWHSPRFAGEQVPPLAAAVHYARAQDLWLNIEIKPATGQEARTGTVVALATAALYADLPAAAAPDPRLPLFSSFRREALAAAQAAAPHIPRGFLVDRVPPDWREQLDLLGCVALHTNHRDLSAQLVREVKAAGYWLFCYTVNEPQRARELLGWGVDSFCTDRIDLIGPDFAAT
jgi:glycerophosphoryl diester phosphodiesterase